jgi:hypothetical protein
MNCARCIGTTSVLDGKAEISLDMRPSPSESADAVSSNRVLACEWDFSKDAPDQIKRFCRVFRTTAATPSALCGASEDGSSEIAADALLDSCYANFVVGSDVLYSEALIEPLLRGVAQLMGPGSTAILANERRCQETYTAFIDACKARFRGFRLVPRRQMPEDAPETMYIVELRRPNPK